MNNGDAVCICASLHISVKKQNMCIYNPEQESGNGHVYRVKICRLMDVKSSTNKERRRIKSGIPIVVFLSVCVCVKLSWS